jgi:glycosyltransferase involved in cell wall biosynthesis
MPATFVVLLSTYNGEKYLAEQLDSLLAQDYADVRIEIRDDGSTDSTHLILDRYADRHKNINVVRGDNLGVAQSFFRLLDAAGDEPAYFAFCDQDDVWLANKLSRAASALSEIDAQTPALYFSNFELVDEQLNHLGYPPPFRYIGFQNALVQNVATGCTVVLNRAARALVLSRLPEHVIMHDWWSYLVISALGKLIYDDTVTVKYRQHAANAVGYGSSPLHRFGKKIARFTSQNLPIFYAHRQARELSRLYADVLSSDDLKTLNLFIQSKRSFLSRLRYALSNNVKRSSYLEALLLKFLIIFNRY